MSFEVYNKLSNYYHQVGEIKQALIQTIKEDAIHSPEKYHQIYKVARQAFQKFKEKLTTEFQETDYAKNLPTTFRAESIYFEAALIDELKKVLKKS